MGIRFGRLRQDATDIEWTHVSHCECDGIGAFARLLRQDGASLASLPQTQSSCRSFLSPLWNLWRHREDRQHRANRLDWNFDKQIRSGPSQAVAWHLFREEETIRIIHHCRERRVTVNSFLLKHLDQAVRPEIRRPATRIPWMVPVNLRGDVRLPDDTENHVSCIDVWIANDDSPEAIHRQIRDRLQRGEHRANYLLLNIGRLLGMPLKVKLLRRNRSRPNGNIGAFSNLGVWDKDKAISNRDSWLFCPPVVDGQLLGAGCVTFQGRMGLTLQAHPWYAGDPQIASRCLRRWVAGMEHAVADPIHVPD